MISLPSRLSPHWSSTWTDRSSICNNTYTQGWQFVRASKSSSTWSAKRKDLNKKRQAPCFQVQVADTTWIWKLLTYMCPSTPLFMTSSWLFLMF